MALYCNMLLCGYITVRITAISASFLLTWLTKGLLMPRVSIKAAVEPLRPLYAPTYWGKPAHSIKTIYITPWRKLARSSYLFHVRHTVETLLR